MGEAGAEGAEADGGMGPLSGGDAGDVKQVVPAERTGFYAVRRVYQQTQSIRGSLAGVTLNGNLLNTHTVYSLATISAQGAFEERACGADIKSQDNDGQSGIFESAVTVNPAVFEKLEPLSHSIHIGAGGWMIPTVFVPIGWTAKSASDPIPTTPSDARVFDLDGDQKPGITVTLSGNLFASGELYAVQTVRYRAEGVFEGDMLVGQDFDTGEQEVLGGTIIDTEQMVQGAGNSATNRMHLVKRADASLTCKQLLADPQAIFPPHPVLD
jgi:hypothetical protein